MQHEVQSAGLYLQIRIQVENSTARRKSSSTQYFVAVTRQAVGKHVTETTELVEQNTVPGFDWDGVGTAHDDTSWMLTTLGADA